MLHDISCFPYNNFLANNITVHNCSYCESPLMGGGRVRYRSPEKVYLEALELQKYGFEGAFFFDDEFNLNIPRALKICELLAPLGMSWRAMLRADLTTRELLVAMKHAGFHEVPIGFESGSNRILANIQKQCPVEKAIRAADLVHEVGLKLKAFMIVGLPGENWESIHESEAFLNRIKPDSVQFSLLTIFPGAPIYKHQTFYDCEFASFKPDWSRSWQNGRPEDFMRRLQIGTREMCPEELVKARQYLEERFADISTTKLELSAS